MIKITPELEDIAIKAAKAVETGILGIDLMEDDRHGLLVHEINNTVEFRGASSATGMNIAQKIIDYLLDKRKT
jgi:[lysine-biosynthesis-protein LysW]--L-2-aminoadipate ligase